VQLPKEGRKEKCFRGKLKLNAIICIQLFYIMANKFLLLLCVIATIVTACQCFKINLQSVSNKNYKSMTKNTISPLRHRLSRSSHQSSLYMSGTSPSKLKVGIVGSTGAVGLEILSVMEHRNFPASEIHLFASERSAGAVTTSSKYGDLSNQLFTLESASVCDVIFLAVSGDFALKWAEKLSNAGCLVIDNSSAFRYKDGIPLVVPEINIGSAKGKKLISNPVSLI
jgi:Semialdehyde dehydrogenase, NAD binding domain